MAYFNSLSKGKNQTLWSRTIKAQMAGVQVLQTGALGSSLALNGPPNTMLGITSEHC